MKAKEVYIIDLMQDDGKNHDWIVTFDVERVEVHSDVMVKRLEFGGRFTLRSYALKFAKLLREGGA